MSSIYGNAASGIGTAANNYANQSLYANRTNTLMLCRYGGGTSGPAYAGTDSAYTNPATWIVLRASSNA